MSVIPRFSRLQKKITFVRERSPLHAVKYQFHLESWWVNIEAYLNFPLWNLENLIVELNLNICRLSLHLKPRKEANKQANSMLWLIITLSSNISEIYKPSLIKTRITDIFTIQMFRLKRKKNSSVNLSFHFS